MTYQLKHPFLGLLIGALAFGHLPAMFVPAGPTH